MSVHLLKLVETDAIVLCRAGDDAIEEMICVDAGAVEFGDGFNGVFYDLAQ